MRAKLILFAIVALGFGACKKKNAISKVPFIYFESLTPDKVKASSPVDSVFITFKVSDGDGDLGVDPQTGGYDIYMVDSRLNQTNPYFFPTIPSNLIDKQKGVSAHCTVAVSSALFLQLRNDTVHKMGDTLTYKIYVKDRAGNTSDTITTPNIYLFP